MNDEVLNRNANSGCVGGCVMMVMLTEGAIEGHTELPREMLKQVRNDYLLVGVLREIGMHSTSN
jgi:hypothetical protein